MTRPRQALAARLASAALAALAALPAAQLPPPLTRPPLVAVAWPIAARVPALAAAILVAARRPGAGYLAVGLALAASLAAGAEASEALAALVLLLASSALYSMSMRLERSSASVTTKWSWAAPAESLLLHGFTAATAYYGGVFALRLYEALQEPPKWVTGPGALVLRLLSESPAAKLALAASLAAGLYYLASSVAAPLLYVATASPGEARAALKRSLFSEAEQARRGMLWYHRALRWSLRLAGLLLGSALAALTGVLVATLLAAPGPLAAALLAAASLPAARWLLGLPERPGRWRTLALASALLLLLVAAYTAAVEPGWASKDLGVLWAAATGGQPPAYSVETVLASRLAYYEGVLEKDVVLAARLLELAARLFWG